MNKKVLVVSKKGKRRYWMGGELRRNKKVFNVIPCRGKKGFRDILSRNDVVYDMVFVDWSEGEKGFGGLSIVDITEMCRGRVKNSDLIFTNVRCIGIFNCIDTIYKKRGGDCWQRMTEARLEKRLARIVKESEVV